MLAAQRQPQNRLYVSYRCLPTGVDCKNVGPSSRCFCGHLYKHHATDNYKDRNVHCREAGCPCTLFQLIPGHGSRFHLLRIHVLGGIYQYRSVCLLVRWYRHSVLSSMYRYVKCSCKHDYDEHDVRGRHKCKRCNCSEFAPTQSCPCGHPHRDHQTVYESRDERVSDGRPVAGAWTQPTE